jgi:hypothetical protein
MRYFVLRSPDAAPKALARLDEHDVEVSVLQDDDWHQANHLLEEIVSDVSWHEIDADTAAEVAITLDLPLVVV